MIRIQDLSFSYGDEKGQQQLKHIDLEIAKGEFVLLCGKSGCGKTSLIRLMNGLVPNYYEGILEGEISIDGVSLKHQKIYEISRKVSTVFQNPKSQFFNTDTTSEILFSLENRGTAKEVMAERLKRATAIFDMGHLLDQSIFNLSGGEKQKVAIAGAYAADTDIILLDEPTSNLDMAAIENIRKMLFSLKAQGKTIVISEHRLHFLRDLIDRAVYLSEGEVTLIFSRREFNEITEERRISLGLRPISMDGLKVSSDWPKAEPTTKEMYIETLQFRYPGRKDFALQIEEERFSFGHIVGIIGKNGQGKSTFAHALIGLEKRAKSKVKVEEKWMNGKKRLQKSYLVMQNVGYQLFTESVEEELKLGAHKGLKEMDVAQTLRAMNIEFLKEVHPLALSGGQQQRVSIGAGLCAGSEILFLDEPTSGMDYYHMIESAKMVKKISAEDNIIFIISHDLEFLINTVDTILCMEEGKVKERYPFCQENLKRVQDTLSHGAEKAEESNTKEGASLGLMLP